MRFYTNVVLRKDSILVREHVDGKRIKKRVSYQPSIFIHANQSDYHTISGAPVKREIFASITRCRDYIESVKSTPGFRIYGSDKWAYNYLYDTYPGHIEFDVSQIVVANIDIEVGADKGFPDIDKAEKPITSICVEVGGRYHVFSCVPYNNKSRKTVSYYRTPDEETLLLAFLDWWEKTSPDVVTGWNIDFFDIPYLVNRIMVLFDKNTAKRLSPWKILNQRKVEIKGKEREVYLPVGVSVLDYLRLYKKFKPGQRESFSLDYISYLELGERKMSFSKEGSLYKLYKSNPQKFINYNIRDCVLVKKLEQELKLLELCFTIALDAKVNFDDALGAVVIWDTIITNYLMDRKTVVPSFVPHERTIIRGAHVKEPQAGMHDWVMSFDLTSLYPMLIQQFNISPDTFLEKLKKNITVDDFVYNRFTLQDYLKEKDACITANLCLYTRKKQGFLPTLMEQQFSLRNEYKGKMLALEKQYERAPSEELKKDISKYDNFQQAKKIQLNSLYGVLSNPYFRWYNIDNAEAVTTSGQVAVRKVQDGVNAYLNKILGTKDADYIIAADTDSLYIKMKPLVEKVYGGNLPSDKTRVVKMMDKLGKQMIQPVLDKVFAELAAQTNAYANKMYMKREAICDRAIWRAAKNYSLYIYDNEGVTYKEPKLKTKGMEMVRSSTPEVCRNKLKEALMIMMTQTEEDMLDFIEKFQAEYKKLSFEDIAFPRTVNGLNKYHDKATLFKKRSPAHVKGALIYNQLLEEAGLTDTYPIIYDKDKIKWAYLKEQSPTADPVIAVPARLPKELDLHRYLDYDTMFEKSFLYPLVRILNAINWRHEREETNTLDKFFKEVS